MSRTVVIAFLTYVFTTASPTIAGLIMLAKHGLCGGGLPKSDWVAEMAVLIVAAGFVVLLFLRSQNAMRSGQNPEFKELVTYAVVGLVGALGAILKMPVDAAVAGKTLEWNFVNALLMLALVAGIFTAAGAVVAKYADSAKFTAFCYVLSGAALIAGTAGAVIQLLYMMLGAYYGSGIPDAGCGERHLGGIFKFGSTAYFISAPSTAFLFALYSGAVAMGAKAVEKPSRRLAVLVCGALGAAVLSSLWAIRDEGAKWGVHAVWIFLALQMPAVWMAILVDNFQARKGSLSWWCLGAFVVGFACALAVALSFYPDEEMTPFKMFMFALAHGLTSLFTVFGVGYLMRTLTIQGRTKVSVR